MAARKLAAPKPKAEKPMTIAALKRAETNAAKFEAKTGMRPIGSFWPRRPIPPGKVLLHRSELCVVSADDERFADRVVCRCGGAPWLGMHYTFPYEAVLLDAYRRR